MFLMESMAIFWIVVMFGLIELRKKGKKRLKI